MGYLDDWPLTPREKKLLKPTRELTETEIKAIRWARSNYKDWRKRLSETREEQAAKCPLYFQRTEQGRQHWAFYYDMPFGRLDWNEFTQVLHRLFQDGVLKP